MYNSKNLSKLFLVIGFGFSILAFLNQTRQDSRYSNKIQEVVYSQNSNIGLNTIAFAIIASISFYCCAKLIGRKAE